LARRPSIRREWRSIGAVLPKLGPGAYCVLFELDRDMTIRTGRLGRVDYQSGVYAYVGSAMKGISSRMPHHVRPPVRPHWHIDYVRPKGRPVAIVAAESDTRVECPIARYLADAFDVAKGFGASDCSCSGHLFRGQDASLLLDAVVDAVRSVGRQPNVTLSEWAPLRSE